MEASVNMCPGFALSNPFEHAKALDLPARTLAFIGDSVFELGIRLQFAENQDALKKQSHALVTAIVCAQNQSQLFDLIQEDLSIEERECLRKWRNAKQTYTPRHVTRGVYAKSTAFEAWVGFLFLTGQQKRLEILFQTVKNSQLEISRLNIDKDLSVKHSSQ